MVRGGAKGKALFLEEINGLEQRAPELSIDGAHPAHTGSEWGGYTSEGSPGFIKVVSLQDVQEHTHTRNCPCCTCLKPAWTLLVALSTVLKSLTEAFSTKGPVPMQGRR